MDKTFDSAIGDVCNDRDSAFGGCGNRVLHGIIGADGTYADYRNLHIGGLVRGLFDWKNNENAQIYVGYRSGADVFCLFTDDFFDYAWWDDKRYHSDADYICIGYCISDDWRHDKLRKRKKCFAYEYSCAIMSKIGELYARNRRKGERLMKHVKTLNTRKLQNTIKKGGCGECQTSCQSACKTSCTVGNQTCEQYK